MIPKFIQNFEKEPCDPIQCSRNDSHSWSPQTVSVSSSAAVLWMYLGEMLEPEIWPQLPPSLCTTHYGGWHMSGGSSFSWGWHIPWGVAYPWGVWICSLLGWWPAGGIHGGGLKQRSRQAWTNTASGFYSKAELDCSYQTRFTHFVTLCFCLSTTGLKKGNIVGRRNTIPQKDAWIACFVRTRTAEINSLLRVLGFNIVVLRSEEISCSSKTFSRAFGEAWMAPSRAVPISAESWSVHAMDVIGIAGHSNRTCNLSTFPFASPLVIMAIFRHQIPAEHPKHSSSVHDWWQNMQR